MKRLIALLLIWLLPYAALADVITLTSGTEITGAIMGRTAGGIKVALPSRITMTIPLDKIYVLSVGDSITGPESLPWLPSETKSQKPLDPLILSLAIFAGAFGVVKLNEARNAQKVANAMDAAGLGEYTGDLSSETGAHAMIGLGSCVIAAALLISQTGLPEKKRGKKKE